MKKFAVIVAGGNGQRMESALPKQFLLLKEKPIIWYTLQTFLKSFSDLQIILVLPQTFIENGKSIVTSLDTNDRIKIIQGGDTRFQSVKNGLQLVETNSIVFVHDGVRCLIDEGLIQRCYWQAIEKGSAVPVVTATDSIRIVEGENHSVCNRNNIRIIQTPQTFQSNILLPAFQQPYIDDFTDEATVVEANGNKVYLIEGNYNNIKITRPVDLWIAEKLIEEKLMLK